MRRTGLSKGLFRLAVCGVCLVVSLPMCAAQKTKSPPVSADKGKSASTDADYYELMKLFVDTFEQIDRNYVTKVDRRKLMEAAIRGMVAKLDPYSSYISPEDIERFNLGVEQQFGGIGIQVSIDPQTGRLTVMTPLPGTPAYKAGVRAGDVIEQIEGKSTKGYTIGMAVRRLKGKIGDAVSIGVRHAGSKKIETVRIVRAVIQVATVLGDHYNSDGTWNYFVDEKNKIGYIRLTHFARRSAAEFHAALKTLKAAGMKGLVVDLRFNPGGLLSQAIAISDLFVDSGKIVSTKGRNTPERVWRATKAGTYADFPVAVLVNHYSASASEILSACLQDHKRAVIIGGRTWGKGSVQNVIELNGGRSALKLTTAGYHRPSGRNIHRAPGAKATDVWGVMPNHGFEVKLSLTEMQDYLEYRRQRDVLGRAAPPKMKFTDRPLKRAVAYLLKKLSPQKTGGSKTTPAKKSKALPAPRPRSKEGKTAVNPKSPVRFRRTAAA